MWAYVSLFCIDNPSNGATLVDGCTRDRVTQLWFLHGTEITEHASWWGWEVQKITGNADAYGRLGGGGGGGAAAAVECTCTLITDGKLCPAAGRGEVINNNHVLIY